MKNVQVKKVAVIGPNKTIYFLKDLYALEL